MTKDNAYKTTEYLEYRDQQRARRAIGLQLGKLVPQELVHEIATAIVELDNAKSKLRNRMRDVADEVAPQLKGY